jgi:hypothetical protein
LLEVERIGLRVQIDAARRAQLRIGGALDVRRPSEILADRLIQRMRGEPERWWTASEIAHELETHPRQAGVALRLLKRRCRVQRRMRTSLTPEWTQLHP